MTVSLIATTTRAVWLLDPATGRARLIDEGRGVYYGISFTQDTVFVACRQVDVGADRDSQDNVILCFDTALRQTDVLRPPTPIRDVHQIFVHAGTLYVCSTYDDALFCFDIASRDWSVWHPFGEEEERNRHHINSVAVDEAGILLAGNRPHGWFARFSPDRRPMTPSYQALGNGTHNVWRDKMRICVCSSNEGAIRFDDGTMQPVMANAWLRGYGTDGRHHYLGVSQNLVRSVRERSHCMVLQLDEAGTLLRSFAFAGYGMLHDLRLVGCSDPSHNGVALKLAPGTGDHGENYQTSSALISLARD